MSQGPTLKVTLTSSPIGQDQRQRRTLRGLGLTRVGSAVVVPSNNPAIRGMISKVAHLVRVES